MTLIAALPCETGLVICADSQETVGDYKVSVNKVTPVRCGRWIVVFGGAGNDSALIDGLEDAVRMALSAVDQSPFDAVKSAVAEFHRVEIALHPGDAATKRLEALVCVKDGRDDQALPCLFHISGPVVRTVDDSLLIGWDAALYRSVLNRLYRRDMSLSQAVALAIHVFLLAKDTCTWIGGDTRLTVIVSHGAIQEDTQDTSDIERRLADVNKRLDEILLACPDLTEHPAALDAKLTRFKDAILNLQEEYMKVEGRKLLRGTIPGYQTLPYGSLLWIGTGADDGAFSLLIPAEPRENRSDVSIEPPKPEESVPERTRFKCIELNEKWGKDGKPHHGKIMTLSGEVLFVDPDKPAVVQRRPARLSDLGIREE